MDFIAHKSERLKVFYEKWIRLLDANPGKKMTVRSGFVPNTVSGDNRSFICLDLDRNRNIALSEFIEAMKYNIIYISMERLFQMRCIFCAHVVSAIRFQLVNLMRLNQPASIDAFMASSEVRIFFFHPLVKFFFEFEYVRMLQFKLDVQLVHFEIKFKLFNVFYI